MSWAHDRDNIMHALALGVAEREFRSYIDRGIGTREQFANAILLYSHRHPDLSLGDLSDRMKGALDQWIQDKTLPDFIKMLESPSYSNPSSAP